MLATPMTTTNQYGSETDDVFIHETLSQSPSDGFVGLPPPPPPPPVPPLFNSNMINHCKILLPHQEVNLVVNRANISEIQARSIPSMLISSNNIWTRRVLPNLRIKQTVFDQHFGDSKSIVIDRYRRASVSTSPQGGGGGGSGGGINDDGPLSFVLLDATSKMLYDVPMRHLLQLVRKDYDDDASIDHVIRAVDETHMKSEWLDAVTALNKQFDKRPEDKARVLSHKGSTHGLVLIEQFFVKLVRVPAYEFKLIYLKFREEAPTQLERMSKHITDLLESVEMILNNEQLPGILHLLCLLYNSITGKTIPGLHFDSLLSVLSTRTLNQNTTVAHLLCHLLEEQYSTLLNIFDNQILLKLKDLSSIKYIPIYIDIRLLYTRYKQLNNFEQELMFLPEHIKTTLSDLQVLFTKLFDNEILLKKGEKDLSTYFCSWDLLLDICFSTLGQFIEKIRLAHVQNIEQRRRNQLLTKPQRTIQTPTRLFRNTHSPYCSDTNIFRDQLNVPLTPITARQRSKVNRISRDRYSSSRDVCYDEQPEQIIQNLLSNAAPRKRGHSPTAKTVLTKRPFNVLGLCATNKQREVSNDIFTAKEPDNTHEETKMDCSTTESAIVPTANIVSTCENQPAFYLTTPIRHLLNTPTDQSIPNNTTLIPIKYENDSFTRNEHLEYSDKTEIDKENNINHLLTSAQNSTELPSLPNATKDDSQPLLLADYPTDKTHISSVAPVLSSDFEALDEGFESQSNISEITESTPQTFQLNDEHGNPNNKQISTSNKNSPNSTDQPKTNISTKRIPSIENLRSISTNNIISRNIQRCAVSRRISTEKDAEETQTSSLSSIIQSNVSTINHRISSIKSKNIIRNIHSLTHTSAFARPLRAFQMSTIANNEICTSPKATRKSTSHHNLTIQKTIASRTICTAVLPSSTSITNQKHN